MSVDREYVCGACKGTFTSDWSEAEAMAEAVDLFGTVEDPVPMCDTCYQEVLEWLQVTDQMPEPPDWSSRSSRRGDDPGQLPLERDQ